MVFHNIYPDNVKRITIEGVLQENHEIKSENLEMLRSLLHVLDDSVKLNISEGRIHDSYIFYHKQESIERNVDFDGEDFFGSISVSNVIRNETSNRACYYLAIQCGNDCSAGYIVYTVKTSSKWVIDEIIPLWY